MLPLLPGSSLDDLQAYVAKMEDERGFSSVDVLRQALMLGEEFGELCKALRKQQNFPTDPNSVIGTVSEELADIVIHVCSIANRLDIRLEEAFRQKEVINETRNWK